MTTAQLSPTEIVLGAKGPYEACTVCRAATAGGHTHEQCFRQGKALGAASENADCAELLCQVLGIESRGFFEEVVRLAGEKFRPTQLDTTLPPGTAVAVTRDDGSAWLTRTRTEPWQLGDGTWVVALEGRAGGFKLDRVRRRDKEDAP